ncbi:hypothetical protein [Mesorhizobium sp.]|uniref:hypothetical protein n=1 Tax=Mesorhizobium sp. TaxID=1871066 RepID=UPI0011FEE20A|nr:hypothetical protein [Mesorhizobium sp.]TIS98783.1 MAG: hypothetical protein E5W87_23815 [Mesorhizobium sp.]
MRKIDAVLLVFLFGLAGFIVISPSRAADPSAAERMSQAGPEEEELKKQTGSWDVVASLWPAPGAEPIVARGLVAERTMIGPILQEIMRPAPDAQVPDFTRLDYLNFDRVEGRWKYVSMDTRFPVSIMPARSFGSAAGGKIDVQFEPQGFVGFGPEVEGRFMISDMAISSPDPDHVLKEQHVMMANGTGKSWLFVRYEYTRRK